MVGITMLLCLTVYGLYNIKKAIWLLLFLMMAIPLGTIAPGVNTIELLRIGSVSIFELLIIFYLIVSSAKHPVKVRKYLILPSVLIVMYISNVILSTSKYGINSTFADAKDYIIAMLILILVVQVSDKYDLSNFCSLVLKAVFMANIIVWIGYILTYQTFLPSSYRFGFAVQSLSIFTIPYIIYSIIILKKYKRWMIVELIFQIYMMMISQNRTNPIIILAVLVVMSVYYIIMSKNVTKKIKRKIFLFGLTVVLVFIGIALYVFLNQDITTGFLGRINEMLLGDFSTDSTKVRNINLEYYTKEVAKQLFGVGLGSYMPALSIFSLGFDQSTMLNYSFDNAYVTIAYKMGFITAVIYLLFILQHVIWNYKQRKNKLIYFFSMLVLIGLGVSGSLLTIQLAKSINVYGFYMAFIVFLRELGRSPVNENKLFP